jgi:hypothetical protein
MLQKILTKYWLVVIIGFTVLSTWIVLPGSVDSSPMIFLLWLSLLATELVVLIPAVRKGETLYEARTRTLKSLAGDAYLYVGLLMVAYLFVQWLNGGCIPEYNVNAGLWSYSKPDKEWLPFSIDRVDSLRMVSVFAACVVFGVSLRNAVGKRSKRYLLQWLSSISGAMAVFCVWKGVSGNAPYAAFMENPELSSWGSFFGFWMVMGFGSYADSQTNRQRRTEIIYLLAIVGNFVGMLYFAQLSSLLLYSVITLIILIYIGFYLSAHVTPHFLIKFYLLTILIMAGFLIFVFMVLPQSVLTDKIGMTADISGYWQNLLDSKSIRSQAALEIWKENMWFGKGAEGFQHYIGNVRDNKGWSFVRVNKGFVYNDFLQVLCEFGLLGTTIFSALIMTMVIPVCYRAHVAWGTKNRDYISGRKYLLRISPLVVTGVVATLCCMGESFVASPYRFPGLFVSVFIVILSMPAFLPSK